MTDWTKVWPELQKPGMAEPWELLLQKLSQTYREGWVKRGVQCGETLFDHCLAAYPVDDIVMDMDQSRIRFLCLAGLFGKALRGDTVTYGAPADDVSRLAAEKDRAERTAVEQFCVAYGDAGQYLLAAFDEYQEQQTCESRYARQLHKIATMWKAFEYEVSGQAVDAQEFIDFEAHLITEPKMLEEYERLLSVRKLMNAT